MSDVPVRLGPAAREVALAEAQAVLAMVQDGTRRARLADLVADIDEGAVAGETAEALQELLELGLATGRVRALYGPEGEQAALATFRRLPRGAELAAAAREVTHALAALEGSTLEQLDVASAGPGAYVVSVRSSGRELSLRLDRQGVRIQSLSA